MKKVLLDESGVILEFLPEETLSGFHLVHDWMNIGMIADPPKPKPAPVPESVSRFQALAALYQAGFLDDIEAYMADPATDFLVKLAWKEAQEFYRGSPTVESLGVLLGLSESQMDDLFRFAATIKA